jgi:hypothetical protein
MKIMEFPNAECIPYCCIHKDKTKKLKNDWHVWIIPSKNNTEL